MVQFNDAYFCALLQQAIFHMKGREEIKPVPSGHLNSDSKTSKRFGAENWQK